MSVTRIKICGVLSVEMAEFCISAGAHYVGLVFHQESRRHINNLALAKSIAIKIKQLKATPVAVFVDQEYSDMQKIIDFTGIDTIQLHGPNSRNDQKSLSSSIHRIFAIPIDQQYLINQVNSDKNRDLLLFDHPIPGGGKLFNYEYFDYLGNLNFFIAGGLSSHNVSNCIKKLNPFGVDISSGVESSPGVKNKQLITQFIAGVNHVT